MSQIAGRHRWAVELLEIKPGERVLEIGCGNGIATGLALAAGAEVVAVDRSAKMVEACWKRNADVAGLEVLEGEFETLDLGRFDKAFAVNVDFPLHPDRGWAGKFREVIRPGGRLILVLEAPGGAAAERFALAASATLASAVFHVDTVLGQNMVAVLAERIA
jgi:SAM-dependent methyltransferase